jgi:hypothetical protein
MVVQVVEVQPLAVQVVQVAVVAVQTLVLAGLGVQVQVGKVLLVAQLLLLQITVQAVVAVLPQ